MAGVVPQASAGAVALAFPVDHLRLGLPAGLTAQLELDGQILPAPPGARIVPVQASQRLGLALTAAGEVEAADEAGAEFGALSPPEGGCQVGRAGGDRLAAVILGLLAAALLLTCRRSCPFSAGQSPLGPARAVAQVRRGTRMTPSRRRFGSLGVGFRMQIKEPGAERLRRIQHTSQGVKRRSDAELRRKPTIQG